MQEDFFFVLCLLQTEYFISLINLNVKASNDNSAFHDKKKQFRYGINRKLRKRCLMRNCGGGKYFEGEKRDMLLMRTFLVVNEKF